MRTAAFACMEDRENAASQWWRLIDCMIMVLRFYEMSMKPA